MRKPRIKKLPRVKIKPRMKSKQFAEAKPFGLPGPLWLFFQCLIVFSTMTLVFAAGFREPSALGWAGLGISFASICWLVFPMGLLERFVAGFSPFCGLIAIPYAVAGARLFAGHFSPRVEASIQSMGAFLAASVSEGMEAPAWALPHLEISLAVIAGIALWLLAYGLVNGLRLSFIPAIRCFNGVEIAFLVTAVLVSLVLSIFIAGNTTMLYAPAEGGESVGGSALQISSGARPAAAAARADGLTAAGMRANGATAADKQDEDILGEGIWFEGALVDALEEGAWGNLDALAHGLKQPLQGLFALPFGITASWISFFYEGELPAFDFAMTIMQAVALALSMVIFSRLLDLGDMDQLCFLLIYLISYPVLFFMIQGQSNIFALFWLAMCIHAFCQKEATKEAWQWACYTGAAGSFLPSVLLIAFASKQGDWKERLAIAARTGLVFLLILTAFGGLPILRSIPAAVGGMAASAAEAPPLRERFVENLAFARNCLISPEDIDGADAEAGGAQVLLFAEGADGLGLALWILALAGFALNIKNKYCRICFTWLVLSFCLIGLGGWAYGAYSKSEYTLLLSWALFSLAYAGLHKALQRFPLWRLGVGAAAFVTLAAVNIRAFRALVLLRG